MSGQNAPGSRKRLNERIVDVLEWPCGLFDRLRDWLEAGDAARQARLNAAPVTTAPLSLPAMRAAFRTTVLEGGESPRYKMVFEFKTLGALHLADDEWRAAIARSTSDTGSTK